jgi:hypothetical protein
MGKQENFITAEDLLNGLELEEKKKTIIQLRWLETAQLMESRADKYMKVYNVLQFITLITVIITPIFININTLIATASGILAALSLGVNQSFQYEKKWRHYRKNVELIYSEGYDYFSLGGKYLSYENHEEAYRSFVSNVEAILKSEVETYFLKVRPKANHSNSNPMVKPEYKSSELLSQTNK